MRLLISTFIFVLYFLGYAHNVYGSETLSGSLLVNGDFEKGETIAYGWNGEVQHSKAEFYIDRKCRYSGKASQAIRRLSSKGKLVRIQQTVNVKPNTTYKITVFCKAKCSYSIGVYEFQQDGSYKYHSISNSSLHNDWKKWEYQIFTSSDTAKLKLHICANSVGTLWVDHASIVPITNVPSAIVKKVKSAPFIDGKLNDFIWKRTTRLPISFILNGGGRKASVKTYAIVCRDDKNIYIGFYCQEPEMKNIQSIYTKRDAPVYMDDSVCVFLDTNYDKVTWFQICVNPNGAVYDEEMLDSFWETGDWRKETPRGTTSAWNPNLKLATYKGKDFWSVELSIPFSNLRAEPKGIWGANFCRIRPAKDEFTTWSYISGGSFHAPKQFGKLIFQ